MPLNGGATVFVVADANAVIDYIRECALHDAGMPPTGRRADMLRVRLGQMGLVLIPETAGREAQRNLRKDLVQKLGRRSARVVWSSAHRMLHRYRDAFECKDKLGHVAAAREMYASISLNPGSRKLAEWKRKKGAAARGLVLGSDANDLKVLSTAAYYAQFYVVELWTHDMDFTMFADEILRVFGVKIVDTYRLDGRSA